VAQEKLTEFYQRKEGEKEQGKYKAVIRQQKIENVVTQNAEIEQKRKNEFLERQAEAEHRMEVIEQEKRRNHEYKKIEAAQREEHIKQVNEQNIIRENARTQRI